MPSKRLNQQLTGLALLCLIALGCDKGVADRKSCQSNSDCTAQGLPESLLCLPLVAGEDLNDYCRANSFFCPFHQNAPDMFGMPKVCDVDTDFDGFADVFQRDGYLPVYNSTGARDNGQLVIEGLFKGQCDRYPNLVEAGDDLPFEGLCVPSAPQTVVGLGEPCLADAQCQSGICTADAPDMGICADGEHDSPCTRDIDCNDPAKCINLQCSDGRSGGGCNRSEDCQSALPCINSICTEGNLGQTCNFDQDCDADLICAQNVCSTGTDGAFCQSNEDCLELVDCIGNACTPVSQQSIDGVCGQARSFGILPHGTPVELSYEDIRPELGGPSCGTDARAQNWQRALLFELPGPARLDVNYAASGADRLFIRSDCVRPSSIEMCEAVDRMPSEVSKRLSLSAGVYSIHASVTESSPEVDFLRLTARYENPADGGGEVHGTPIPAGTCEDPTPVQLGEHSGTSLDAQRIQNGMGEGCNTASGPEAVAVFSPEVDGRVCVTTSGSSYDTVLYVRGAVCQDGAELACNDDRNGVQSAVEFDAFAGVSYYIFVDAYGNSPGGDFHLDLIMGNCP